jgi:hypothetical protein
VISMSTVRMPNFRAVSAWPSSWSSTVNNTLITLYGPREGSTFLRGVRPPSRETLEAARRRHALTPFIIAPLENELFYAIVVRSPDATLLQEIKKVPLVSAVMSVTPSELLGKTTALA